MGDLLKIAGRYEEAEALAVERCGGNANRYGTERSRTIGAITQLIDLCTARHEAEPDKDSDYKAAEWRAKLEEAKQPQGQEEEPSKAGNS